MNNLLKSALCLGVMASSALSSQAFELVSPQEGETITVDYLGSITLVWSDFVDAYPTGELQLLNSAGTEVATGTCDYDMANWSAYTATFTPTITDPGTYTVVVPANMAEDNDNREYRLTYEIVPNTSTPAEPTSITPENGSNIVQDTENYVEFNKIRFDFGNDPSIVLNQNLLSFKDQDGKNVEFTVSGWYEADDPMLQYADCPFININFNDDGNMPSGTYTFIANPGAFSSPRGMYEEKITLTYTYTKTKADVDETPLEIESALMGDASSTSSYGQTPVYTWLGTNVVTITEDMPLAELIGVNNNQTGTGVLVTFNHGSKSNYVTCQLKNLNDNEILTFVEPQKQDDGSFLATFANNIKLYEGIKYALEFHTYDNVQNKTEFGDGASLTFVGTTPAYQYSSAEFVTTVPVSGSTITSLDYTKVTVLYSEPVHVTAQFNLGMGMSEPLTMTPETEDAEYDNVWHFQIPQQAISGYPACEVALTAYDQNGNIVKGNNGIEGNSSQYLSYNLTFYQPRIVVSQSNSHVPEINIFSVYASVEKGINTSWVAYPYVVDAAGTTVATLNQEYYDDPDLGLRPYKELRWTSGSEPEPLELEFQMIPAITEKGKYTLVFPEACFNFGTQFDSETSVAQEFDFYVVDFYPVNYSVDSNTVSLGNVEAGKTTSIAVTPAEGWKLESLTLNDNDVTEDVVNGTYTSPAATAEMNFVAQFSYDGIVVTPSGVDDVVTDLNLRGWSQDGKLMIAGLKAGQVLSVYTVGGCMMTTVNVADEDTLSIAVPEGIYIVTVTDGAKKVALKLNNK